MKYLKRLLLIPFAVMALLLVATGRTGAQPAGAAIQLHYATFDPLLDGEPAVATELQALPGDPHRLIQFHGPIQASWLSDLQVLGVVFYEYIPEYAYTARLTQDNQALVAAHDAVRWVGPLHPAYKISPTLSGGRLLLELYPDADSQAAVQGVLAAGALILDESAGGDLLVVEASLAPVSALAAIADVSWVQDDIQFQEFNDDARWVSQNNVPFTTPLYDRGLTGAGQVGAVSDSGLSVYDFGGSGGNVPSCFFLDDGNSGLGGSPVAPGAGHRKVVGYDVPAGALGDTNDATGHGTHVVGSVVGDQTPWGAPSPADGQAIDARIYFQDIGLLPGTINPPLDYRDMFGEAYDPNGDTAYQPGQEPRTHSNSWGSVEQIYSLEAGQVDDFMWSHPDYLILFAAGNQGPAPNTIGAPATAKNIVAVGATENGLADPDSMGYFSSHGPVPFGRLAPAVSAPGDRLTSALAGDPCGTTEKSGTSMATPTVQGVALLMRQYLVDGYYPSGAANVADSRHPSAALLKAMLMNSGRPMDGTYSDNATGGTWPSNGQGWGRVTADDVLYFDGDHRDLWLHDEYALDGSSGFDFPLQMRTFTIEVGDGGPFQPEPLEVTLAWSDYPGSPLAGGALVNDLDLVVTAPDGTQHRGNDTLSNDFAGLPPLPAGVDHTNPWETVYLADPQPGTYTITVTAFNIGSALLDPVRKQGFALVATGDIIDQQAQAEFEFPAYEAAPADVTRLRVSDLDLNQDAGEVETVEGLVRNVDSGLELAVTLTETGPDTAIFAGEVVLTSAAPGAGELAVQAGDEVRLTIDDEDDGHGGSSPAVATAFIQRRPVNFINPPQLSDMAKPDGANSYSLNWSAAEEVDRLSHYVVHETTNLSLPLADDAEGNINTLWATGDRWQSDDQYQHSGGFSYWSTDGYQANLSNTILALKSAVALPSTATEARFSFYSRYHNFIFDDGHIEISADGGASWQPLRRLYAAPVPPPQDDRMQFHQFDLTAFLGQAIQVRFRFDTTDGTVPGAAPGWWVDDITISTGSWQKVGTTDPDVNTFNVAGQAAGQYAYRVRGVFADGSVSGWSNVATTDVTDDGGGDPPGQEDGGPRATGGGWLQSTNGNKVNFALNVRMADDRTLSGHVHVNEKAVKIKVIEITDLGAPTANCNGVVDGPDALEIQGRGEYNKEPATFLVCVEDKGEPDLNEDRFYLTCLDGCDYNSYHVADGHVVQGGNIQVRGADDAQDGASETPAPTVVTLGDPLLEYGLPGTLETFNATVYDQDQQPLSGTAVTLRRENSDGTVDQFTAETGVDGVAHFTVTHLDQASEYVATAGGVESNWVHIRPPLSVS